MRVANSDYQVPNSPHTIEKNTAIIIPINELHNDPEYYPEPDRFDPERFALDAIKQRHPCLYMPFGDDPRNCIGMRFGKIQSKIGIISLVSSFKFSVCERTPIPLEFTKSDFLTTPTKGIYLKMEKI